MTGLSLGLVLLSSIAHSTWNLLLKRSGAPEVFVWCLLVAASVMLVPLGAALYDFNPVESSGWWFVLATIGLHILYFVMLGRGYAQGDLSLVYPVARGLGPMLVPVLAFVILDEAISSQAILGIVAIIIGIYTVSLWGSFGRLTSQPMIIFREPGFKYAVLTGLTIASYAIVDKEGVDRVQPFLYMYFMTLGSAVGLAPYIVGKWGVGAIRLEWRANTAPITLAALLTFTAYGLVLTAFSLSRVSYVAPAREVGIVIGVLMGLFILKEPFARGRLVGSAIILVGLLAIALAP